MCFVDFPALERFLTNACNRYERTAPTVRNYCNNLYIRVQDNQAKVSLAEITGIGILCVDGCWLTPNAAANAIYHLMDSLGMDVSGHAGF